MAKLICDICGTSYSASDDKCPTCGYARAFAEADAAEETVHVERERVRGGRFSRKNVRKRMKALEESGAEPEAAATVADMSFELGEAVAAADFRPEEVLEPAPVPADLEPPVAEEPVSAEPEKTEEVPAAEPEIVMDWPILEAVEADDLEEEAEPVPVLFPELPEAEEAAVGVDEIEEPAETAEVEASADVVPILFPELPEAEEAAFEVAAIEESAEAAEEETEETEVPVIPLILPVEEETAPETTAEEAEGKKKVPVLRMVLIVSAAVLLLCLAYLAVRFGIPYLQELNQPGPSVVETTEPTGMTTEPATEEQTEPVTDAPTEAPTDPPTEPPTDPPTEPPTEPPTDPPTEPPTEAPTDPPPLEVPLTLNYYELTFRGRDQGVTLKVNGYRSSSITWTSDDPSVVTINDQGKVISVGPGTTYVHASYGGHTVSCVIYCKFS